MGSSLAAMRFALSRAPSACPRMVFPSGSSGMVTAVLGTTVIVPSKPTVKSCAMLTRLRSARTGLASVVGHFCANSDCEVMFRCSFTHYRAMG